MGAPCKYVYLYVCPGHLILLTSLAFWFLYTIKLKLGLHCSATLTDSVSDGRSKLTAPRRHIGRDTSRSWDEDSFVVYTAVYTTGYPHNLLVGK